MIFKGRETLTSEEKASSGCFLLGQETYQILKFVIIKLPIGYAHDGIVKVPDIGSDLKHQFHVKNFNGKV